MLRNINSLTGHVVQASDGEIGTVKEFLFDDLTWHIRYMVVETGDWLSSRKVLIAPASLRRPEWSSRAFPVDLTRDQVRRSPDIDTDKPVSRQHELELAGHYDWPLYWAGFYDDMMSGEFFFPADEGGKNGEKGTAAHGDPHLHSTRSVQGYRLHAADGHIGHVADYIADMDNWSIRYLVAATANWLPGRKVLISPHWIEKTDWRSAEVFVDLTREAIKLSPPFDPAQPVKPDYESELYDHYGRPKLEERLVKK